VFSTNIPEMTGYINDCSNSYLTKHL